jgi:hypothetical protein
MRLQRKAEKPQPAWATILHLGPWGEPPSDRRSWRNSRQQRLLNFRSDPEFVLTPWSADNIHLTLSRCNIQELIPLSNHSSEMMPSPRSLESCF